MDFILHCDKLTSPSRFPSVSATPSAPKTLYHAANDLVYVNTGSGWQAAAQPGSHSIYSAYSGAAPSTQAAIQTSLQTKTAAPSSVHTNVANITTDVVIRGR